MASRDHFRIAIKKVLVNGGDHTIDWIEPILSLYDHLVKLANKYEKSRPSSLEESITLFQIQRLITYSPLSSLVFQLTHDDLIAIRSAAKAMIAESRQLFINDPEIELMRAANQKLDNLPDIANKAHLELWNEREVVRLLNTLRRTSYLPASLLPASQVVLK